MTQFTDNLISIGELLFLAVAAVAVARLLDAPIENWLQKNFGERKR